MRKRLAPTGGAILDIVGYSDLPVGGLFRADNVKGGSSRATPFRRIGLFRSAYGNGLRSPEVPTTFNVQRSTFNVQTLETPYRTRIP